MKRTLFGIITVFLSVTLVLGVAELVLGVRTEGSWSAAWTSLFGGAVPHSEMGTGKWVVADPKLGYRLNPAMDGINSLGIRHPEISPEPVAGRMRIVVLGDSVAWPEDGFVGMLRDDLADTAEVINAAIPGYTTYQERVLFERDLYPLRPGLLVVQYCLNDNHRFLHRFDPEARLLFTLEARRVILPEEGDPLAWLPRWSYLAYRIRLALFLWHNPREEFLWKQQPDFAVAWQEQSWVEFGENLEALRERMRSIGGKLVVIMIPYGLQFRPNLLARDRDYVLKPQALMAAACGDLGVPLLDPWAEFQERGGGHLFEDDIHLTAEGHALVRDTLLAGLRQLQLLPEGR